MADLMRGVIVGVAGHVSDDDGLGVVMEMRIAAARLSKDGYGLVHEGTSFLGLNSPAEEVLGC